MPNTDVALEATRAALDRLIATGAAPGVQYMFVSADEALLAHHAGLADPVQGRPVTAATTFNAYSVTKTFTAAAVLMLAEQGLIGLDQPLTETLGRGPQIGAATVRQTLLHTGGFANPNPMRWVHLAGEHASFDRAAFVETLITRHGRPISAPGQRYRYSNIGYLLLGELIAQASGRDYRDLIDQRLLAPLCRVREGTEGAKDKLGFDIATPEAHARGTLARRHWLNLLLGFFVDRGKLVEPSPGHWVLLRNHHVNGDAYGGLIGNASAFARYLQALLSEGGPLSPAIRTQLFTPAAAPGPARTLGWFAGELEGEPWRAHAGGGAGYYCELRLYPRLRRGSVVMFNRTGIRDERLLDRLDRWLIASSR